jgi:hypothetical protein
VLWLYLSSTLSLPVGFTHQVPSASLPLVMGTVTEDPNMLALQWAGMSSSPSSVWTQGAPLPCKRGGTCSCCILGIAKL